ncbi:hypothetical protein AKJ65_08040 [candidate division MSBL1 archaeon SCGC-AAA259E19]|uniref:Uncharacterized protein n=1 Tax=candidate division MSBL1 archaeon SCGC-AAA259E19 TaxID=1698264 RepID=A0A133UD60_9EURY|nr:hypothetical protein AKJ65_08040 [candidate division MSBL1 archaeon SCGC-AAA259E19]
MKHPSGSGRRKKEELVEFVLEKYGVSATFKLIRLEGSDWEDFQVGEYLFRSLGDPPDWEESKHRMAEEYGYPPELEELLERSYARCLVIDDPGKIEEWENVHEENKQNPFYSEHLAPHLDVFFQILEDLLDHDFLIVYSQEKVEEFGIEGVGMIEETFHYLHHLGEDVPIDHEETWKEAEEILEEFNSKPD